MMLRFTMLFSIIATILLATSANTGFAEEGPVWHRNLEQAAKLAAEEGKPLFVVFRCER